MASCQALPFQGSPNAEEEETMKRFVILLMLALSLFSLSLSEGARAGGAYEKELLSGSFEGSKRLFLGLARVNAREATGAYIREFDRENSPAIAFANNGCLIKCLASMKNGYTLVELGQRIGVIRDEELDFSLSSPPPQNSYKGMCDIYDIRADFLYSEKVGAKLKEGESCTVLYEIWPDFKNGEHFYLIETEDFYGYVPITQLKFAGEN